jgi:hypothetical protein
MALYVWSREVDEGGGGEVQRLGERCSGDVSEKTMMGCLICFCSYTNLVRTIETFVKNAFATVPE